MNFNDPQLTKKGKNLLLRAISGEKIIFTRFKIGNGEISDADTPTEFSDIINPLVSFGITEIENNGNGFVSVEGHFDNTIIKSDFRWRELGLYAKGEAPNDNEILYAYINKGDNAGVLKANNSTAISEQSVKFIIAVGDAEKVTAVISDSVLYISKTEFEEHLNAENPHGVTKEQVGLGNVPNVSTNDQTPTYKNVEVVSEPISGEKMSTAFQKIRAAISALIKHLSNTTNPHTVTTGQIGAAESEHTHAISDVTGLSMELDGIKNPPITEITDFSEFGTVGENFGTVQSCRIRIIGNRVIGLVVLKGMNIDVADANTTHYPLYFKTEYKPYGSGTGLVYVMSTANYSCSAWLVITNGATISTKPICATLAGSGISVIPDTSDLEADDNKSLYIRFDYILQSNES